MPGTLVGMDRNGNRYYEDKTQFYGQDRRVSFASDDPNASQISPQWFSWFHHSALLVRQCQRVHEVKRTDAEGRSGGSDR